MLKFARLRRDLLIGCFAYPLLLLLVNVLIAGKEFGVDYSAYLETNEGTFIAVAKNVAAHPGDLLWWPEWDLGLPFQNTYLPGLHLLVGLCSRLSGHSAGLCYHWLTALFYSLSPVAVYFMAWGLTRGAGASALAALAYSLVSPSAWLMPGVRGDMGGAWNLRRLQILAFYGEGPHTASLFFIPLAILFLYLSLTKGKPWMKVAAGFLSGAAVLMNAFAAVILAMAALGIALANPAGRRVRGILTMAVIAGLAYFWISPLLPPSVVADIRRNSPHVSGDFPFNATSALGAGDLFMGLALLWLAARRRVSAGLQTFLYFTLCAGAVVLLAYYANCNLLPQPHRYGVAFDMGLCLCAVFGGAALLKRISPRFLRPVALVLVLAAAIQTRHDVRYARQLIQGTVASTTLPYRLATWIDRNLNGQRVMVGSALSFHFNVFTNTPQLHGGHDPMQPSPLAIIGSFVITSGMNTGTRDVEIAVTWLKALGAHAIVVPGPVTDPYYKAFANPGKFEGHLPLLWRESDTAIYGVPARSASLAHVVPETALVRHAPVNGLDIDEMSRYVAALENPSLPVATWEWLSRHGGRVEADLLPGQAISIQERYMPGWNATANGAPVTLAADGLGMMALRPSCAHCVITLNYDGGTQWRATLAASAAVMIFVLFFLTRRSATPPPSSAALS